MKQAVRWGPFIHKKLFIIYTGHNTLRHWALTYDLWPWPLNSSEISNMVNDKDLRSLQRCDGVLSLETNLADNKARDSLQYLPDFSDIWMYHSRLVRVQGTTLSNSLLASCPWGPATAHGVGLLTEMYAIYMERCALHRTVARCFGLGLFPHLALCQPHWHPANNPESF